MPHSGLPVTIRVHVVCGLVRALERKRRDKLQVESFRIKRDICTDEEVAI